MAQEIGCSWHSSFSVLTAAQALSAIPKLRDAFLAAAALLLESPVLSAQTVAPPGPPEPASQAASLPDGAASALGGGASALLDVSVKGVRAETSSQISIGRRELELRPRLRPGDLLEAVPGLFAVQHAGGGKANQYFLRGFDADHGTDIAFFVDGVPVNMVSHGHGQGFSDFHFLIPELVVGLDGYKGPYFAQYGDFATAGAVNLRLAETFNESYAQYSVGQYGIMRGLVIESPRLGDNWRMVAAAEVYKDDGPFANPERLNRFNVYFKIGRDLDASSKIYATWMSYASTWNGSGQIPARAVCGEGERQARAPEAYGANCIDHFGNVDPSEGGRTDRHMLSVGYVHAFEDNELHVMAYLLRYNFWLYSNFTFFLEDPVHGDEIEQRDERMLGGLDFSYRTQTAIQGAKFTTTLGSQVRTDKISNGLYHDVGRERLEDKVDAEIEESSISVYVEEDVRVRKWLRFVLGARGQQLQVAVDDRLEDRIGLGNPTSGSKGAVLFLPKAKAIVSPTAAIDVFAALGRGFHSNDARGVVVSKSPATLMTPATGYEVGAQLRPFPGLSIGVTGFLIDLESELVWVGDAGGTEPSGQTRRYGVELAGRYHLSNWLFADVDATFTRPRYRQNSGNGDAVALAPTRTITAGIGVRPQLGSVTPSTALRVKSIGDRPANDDGSLVATGFTIVDANAALRWKSVELGLDVQNIFDVAWREVNFATETRLSYEPQAVTGIHYSPGWPRTVSGRATLYWQ